MSHIFTDAVHPAIFTVYFAYNVLDSQVGFIQSNCLRCTVGSVWWAVCNVQCNKVCTACVSSVYDLCLLAVMLACMPHLPVHREGSWCNWHAWDGGTGMLAPMHTSSASTSPPWLFWPGLLMPFIRVGYLGWCPLLQASFA